MKYCGADEGMSCSGFNFTGRIKYVAGDPEPGATTYENKNKTEQTENLARIRPGTQHILSKCKLKSLDVAEINPEGLDMCPWCHFGLFTAFGNVFVCTLVILCFTKSLLVSEQCSIALMSFFDFYLGVVRTAP